MLGPRNALRYSAAAELLRATRPALGRGSGGLGEGGLHLLFVGQQFAHARPLPHPLEMRDAIFELGDIEVELGAMPEAHQEEARIDGA